MRDNQQYGEHLQRLCVSYVFREPHLWLLLFRSRLLELPPKIYSDDKDSSIALTDISFKNVVGQWTALKKRYHFLLKLRMSFAIYLRYKYEHLPRRFTVR